MKLDRNFLRRSRIENLEGRNLMAGDVGAAVVDGTLYIAGSSGDDTAEVSTVDNHLVLTTTDESGTTQRYFDRRQVQQVVFHGFDGSDRFTNSTAIRAYVYGGNGDDTLISGAGNDVVDGGAGNDVIVSGEGHDVVYGGGGNDFILAGDGNDWVDAGSGDDQIYGEAGDDVLGGGSGNDRLYGDAGRDRLFGDLGHDLLAGGRDNDILVGGAGDDALYGGTGADQLFGEAGYDFLAGGDGYDYVHGGGDYNRYENSSAVNDPPNLGGLTDTQLARIVDAAFARWQAAGLNTSWLRANTEFRVADLPGNALGFTVGKSDGTSVVWIDANAAGKGWFVDGTPLSDAEYAAVSQIMKFAGTSSAAHKVDLLTVTMHEIGHAAGVKPSGEYGLMSEFIPAGLRMLPDARLAASARGFVNGPSLHNGLYADLGLTQYFQPGTQNINWGFFNTIPRSWIGYNPAAQLGAFLSRWQFSSILWGW